MHANEMTEVRVRGFKAFQSSRICFEYSRNRNLYNLHLLSNSSLRKRGFLHETGFSLLHRYRGSLESKEPRFRLLEIEANAVIYIRNFSNEPGTGNSGWSVRDIPQNAYCSRDIFLAVLRSVILPNIVQIA